VGKRRRGAEPEIPFPCLFIFIEGLLFMPEQQSLFQNTPAGLVPKTPAPVPAPILIPSGSINETKAAHYHAHISSDKGKRQVDLVYDALASHPDSTDRELQAVIQGWGHKIEISALPARRADIPEFFPGWKVESSGKKICSVMKTMKCAWRLIKTPSGQLQ